MAKKREEVASRNPLVTPRQPLVENNANPQGSQPVNGATNTPGKLQPDMPVVVKTTQHSTGTPKTVSFEKYAKQASLQQKECFIELGEVKSALRPTPKKRELSHDDEKMHLDTVGSNEPKMKKIVKDDILNAETPSVKVCTLINIVYSYVRLTNIPKTISQ